MKKVWLLAIVVGAVVMTAVSGCGIASFRMIRAVGDDRTAEFNRWWPSVQRCSLGLPIVSSLDKWLDQSYVVLLQNNTELRPSGGFMGSYARFDFVKGGLRRIKFSDIYQPDGQITGHVDPPRPIQEAFKQGWWRLRDSNWDPDYASAAATIDWFLEQGGEPPIDGVVAVNQLTVKQLIGILGSIKLTTYDEVVTEDNFIQLAQKYAEIHKDKEGFMGAMGTVLVEKIKSAKLIELTKLIKLIYSDLEKGQILVWHKEPELRSEIQRLGWSGELTEGWDGQSDYIYVVDTNLGVNKANCCVERKISQVFNFDSGILKGELAIEWDNKGEADAPRPPNFWGGRYINYARVVVPRDKKITGVEVGGRQLREESQEEVREPTPLDQTRTVEIYRSEVRDKLKIIGFWVEVGAGQKVNVQIRTEEETRQGNRPVWVKRQPGVAGFDYKLKSGNKEKVYRIDRDQEIFLFN